MIRFAVILLSLTSIANAADLEKDGAFATRDAASLSATVEGLRLSPEEQDVIAAMGVPSHDPLEMRQTAFRHAAEGQLTRGDVLILNHPLMMNPSPVAQKLLERLRAAVSVNERDLRTAPSFRMP